MVLDQLGQWRRYAGLTPRVEPAFQFLEQVTAATPPGRHELAGSDLYALVQTYTTKPAAGIVFESHRQYLDVQYLVAGRETILWAPVAALPVVTQPYDPAKDCALYAPGPAATAVRLSPGDFAMFLPADGHAPGLECDGPGDVVKVVVKVRVA